MLNDLKGLLCLDMLFKISASEVALIWNIPCARRISLSGELFSKDPRTACPISQRVIKTGSGVRCRNSDEETPFIFTSSEVYGRQFKIFKANWNEWNGRLGIPQTSSDENTNWGTKVASSVRCWTSQETFPTILQRWSSALSDSGLGCYSLVTVVTVVNSADCWNCCALSCKVWNGDVASKYLSGWSRVHLHPSSSWHRPL